ncbi:hypothetical protein [Klebsiella michiganensis]|uniref:DUF4238 domain-containing protein n=1 Tax=Klebsiella michiganensis (strain ATCC 8724 / DSM 4798 / JCM 20051 / NBRC 3318 / NRRL B-199 / KCTC 1686 / BUCSAV 143 / CCM 1901) TaxID=1006551 RepID=A0A0H3H2M0_KLEM8|nr:hypothetical protein [Klebsiella michiganensis]AEX03646.1 hypothetical protein KOX_09600 [Klebsiella michiganensis KCTC 1686]MCG8665063.1 hypothetical protein [Klebsiella michiganensis]
MDNLTRNQHFISQVEQRSNCIDESRPKDKQRIYKFEIADRENSVVRLTNIEGVKIKANLSFDDLFSFDVKSSRVRKNLEDFFQKFETDLAPATGLLISESNVNSGSDVLKDAAERVFKAKFMGWIRNPYLIARTIDMFKGLEGMHPTDPLLLRHFSDIRSGAKPHLAEVCAMFRVTSEQYFQWLEILFLALMTSPGATKSILESTVEMIVESQGLMGHVIVATFDDTPGCRVAVPDTGYLQGTNDPNCNMFLFNLNRSAFAAFSVVDLSKQTLVEIQPQMRRQVGLYNIKFSAQHHHNDMKLLEFFNVLAAYQAHSHIFCADPKIFGITTI